MKKYSRVLAGILAVLLSAGCTGLYAAAQSDSSSAADSTASTTKNESDKKDTKDTKKAPVFRLCKIEISEQICYRERSARMTRLCVEYSLEYSKTNLAGCDLKLFL